jgi:hypothetical protein
MSDRSVTPSCAGWPCRPDDHPSHSGPRRVLVRAFWDTGSSLSTPRAVVRVGFSDRMQEAALAARTLTDGASDPMFRGTLRSLSGTIVG